MRDQDLQTANIQIETLLAQHKAIAKIHDAQDTLDRIEDRQERTGRELVQITHKFEAKWDGAERAYLSGVDVARELKEQHQAILTEVRRFRMVGMAIIFGSSVLSQTELLSIFTRVFG